MGNCCRKPIPTPLLKEHLQILLIGDEGVGKTTLINNYVSGKQDVEFIPHNKELIRIVNASTFIANPNGVDAGMHNVSLTFVDINGGFNNITKQIRDGYYSA